jgi:hypothetical protein
MRIADQIPDKQKQQLSKMKSPKKNPKEKPITKQKKKENLSFKDIEELMGTRRDTYERKNGAVRRK